MARWSYDTSLSDIQNIILGLITNKLGDHVMMKSVLNMNYDEYQVICSKLRTMTRVEECEKYCISIIAAWVASNTFGREQFFYDGVLAVSKRFPQHYHSYIMDFFTSAFYNYQIDTMGVEFKNASNIRKVVQAHGDEYFY